MDETISIQYYTSPCGELIIGSYQERLCLCDWRYRKMRERIDARLQQNLSAGYTIGSSAVIAQTISQLEEYFRKERKAFDLPLLPVGTAFQQEVWAALLELPYGSTDTYLGLAQKLGKRLAIRAVATANGANAISIIIPCHRIIGSDGKLVGYAGGIEAKKKLLTLERTDQGELFSFEE